MGNTSFDAVAAVCNFAILWFLLSLSLLLLLLQPALPLIQDTSL